MNDSRRVIVGVLLSTVLTVIGAAWADAQDVVKVSPETHRVLFENDQVRVSLAITHEDLSPRKRVGASRFAAG